VSVPPAYVPDGTDLHEETNAVLQDALSAYLDALDLVPDVLEEGTDEQLAAVAGQCREIGGSIEPFCLFLETNAKPEVGFRRNYFDEALTLLRAIAASFVVLAEVQRGTDISKVGLLEGDVAIEKSARLDELETAMANGETAAD
jgi:hypothetical protein